MEKRALQVSHPKVARGLGRGKKRGALRAKGDKEALERFIGAELLENPEVQYQLSIIYKYLFEDDKKTLEWLTKAAEKMHVEALFYLGKIHATGQGVPRNDETACQYYAKACSKGHTGSEFELGRMYELGYGVPQSSKLAVKKLKKAAEKGHTDALFRLGKMYCEGRGVALNKPLGCELLQKAGSKGYKIALRLYQEVSHEVALQKAAEEEKAKWLKSLTSSAEEGSVDAQLRLAELYREGTEVPKHPMLAKQWYQRAAKRLKKLAREGDIQAQWKLAELYWEGRRGVPRLPEEAIVLYQKVAQFYLEMLDRPAEAECRLGEVYLRGRGVEKDPAKAVECFERAAAQGHAVSQYYMGRMYARGEGNIPRDIPKAMEWYSKAAEQGHGAAQLCLKRMEGAGASAEGKKICEEGS